MPPVSENTKTISSQLVRNLDGAQVGQVSGTHSFGQVRLNSSPTKHYKDLHLCGCDTVMDETIKHGQGSPV